MLDIVLLAKSVLAGALAATAIMWLASCGSPSAWRRAARWTWAIGGGVLVASGATDQWPHWPALEDRARFLTLLVPICLVVETLVATALLRRLAWILRLGLVAAVTPILLHNTVYLAHLNGPNSAQWSAAQATLVLCALATLLALVWAMMNWLQSRTSTQAVLWALLLDALAAAVTVMLSGYYRGGVLGLGLAGALAGTALASYIVTLQAPTSGSLGMGVIGVFAVVLLGRFFGSLSTSLSACLLFAPLLAWIFELPRLRAMGPRWRAVGRLACVAFPLIVVLIVAQWKFTAASKERRHAAKLRTFDESTITHGHFRHPASAGSLIS